MKRFALITLFFSLASVLMCADIFAQTEAQDDKGVRQDSDNRWMTDGRHKRIPNANQIELYRRAAEQGHASAQKTLGVNRLVVAPVPHRIGQVVHRGSYFGVSHAHTIWAVGLSVEYSNKVRQRDNLAEDQI